MGNNRRRIFVTDTLTVTPEIIPRELLFGNPTRTMPRISPDGKRMAYVAPVNNVLNVWVGDIGSDDYKPLTKDKERGVRLYFWAEDNQHILYLQDMGGNENWRLYAVNLATGDTRDLTPFAEVQAQVVDQNKHFPNELLVALNKENPQLHDVYHLDLTTGELALVAQNPGNIAGWVTDAHFKVRGAWAAAPNGGFSLLVRETEQAEWQDLGNWDEDNTLNSNPLSFSKDGRYIYLIDSRNYNAGRLVKMEIATGNIEVIAEDAHYDVGDVMINPDSYEFEAVSFNRARTDWTVLSESVRADFEILEKLHHGDMSIISRDTADKTWLVAFAADNGPVSYYTYDRQTKAATFMFVNRPEIIKYTLAEMQPFSFTARDGLTVHGYISFPPGVEKKSLPTVLDVHGGPWARDIWGLNPETQWFTNRGYVSLQVNFRGSTGYGKDFVNAGDKQWGANMHNDLLDAVNWAVAQGYVDPNKVAIYGGSYGGYAALVGATFTPDFFTCAIDIVGPSNLVTLIKSIPPYWSTQLAVMHKRVGNPDTDEEFMKSRSPLYKVDQIKIPMLVAQGANDPRVKQAEAEQVVAAMKSKGIEYEYMLFPDEGHGFAKPENRMKFYATAEKFLAKHLGGRYEE